MIASWVPIITALVAIFGGAFAYWNQKRIDRREALVEQRRAVYQHFLEVLFDHVEAKTEESRRAFDRIKCELLLVASDQVLETLLWVQESSVMDGDAVGESDVHDSVLSAIRAMRDDCFESSKIDESKLWYLNPIGKATPLHANLEGHFEP